MSKIVCEICGSTYQGNSSDPCPICGWAHNAANDSDAVGDAAQEQTAEFIGKAPAPKAKSRDIFDFDAVNEDTDDSVDPQDDLSPYDEDDEDYEEEPRTNTFLVVLLVIVIVILLLTSGFIFFKYFMPNANTESKETTAATEQTIPEETEAPETTIPTVPCTSLAITSGKIELTKEGQYFLIHAVASPEDTTDILEFSSEDESIVTVDADGKVTAVGEGETNIIVKCGDQAYSCPVLALFVEDLTAPEEETVAEADTDEIEDADKSDEKTDAAAEDDKTSADPGIEVKLKRHDVTIGRQGVYIELELDCELAPDQVEWSIGNANVATVDKQGRVTSVGRGTTIVTVKNGEHEDTCYIRCVF